MSLDSQSTDQSNQRPSLLVGEVEAARLLGMSRSHFRRHVAGGLDRVYVGRRVLYSRGALERWLDRALHRPSELRPFGRKHNLF